MKHYYSDEGLLNYRVNRELLVDLAKALETVSGDASVRDLERKNIFDMAMGLVYDYDLHDIAPLGGCISREEWRKLPEKTSVLTALKAMLFDFTDQDFVPQEFGFVAWSAICEIQINALVPGEEDDDE